MNTTNSCSASPDISLPLTPKPPDLRASSLNALQEKIAIFMSVVCSIAIGMTPLHIIATAENSADSQKWAYGAIGSIMGFWLRK